jgi:hypothetical protein
MPSLTAIVVNSIGNPPAARTPSLDRLANRASGRLHGVTSFHDDATATWGLSQSSSVMPMARNIARAGALRNPSVTSVERILTFDSPMGRRLFEIPIDPPARAAVGAGSARPSGRLKGPPTALATPHWGRTIDSA